MKRMNNDLVRIIAAIVFAVVICFAMWITKSGWWSVLLLLMMPIWNNHNEDDYDEQ